MNTLSLVHALNFDIEVDGREEASEKVEIGEPARFGST